MPNLEGTQDLVDRVITDHHHTQVSASPPASRLATRITNNVQEELNELWNLRDWTFCYQENSFSAGAGEPAVQLVDGWSNEGEQGLVWVATPGSEYPLRWRRLGSLKGLQKTQPLTGDPQFYSVDGVNMLLYPVPAVTIDIGVFYRTDRPNLNYANPGNLERLPIRWRGLLYEMTVLREMRDKGELAGVAAQSALVDRMKYGMCCEERQGKPETRDWPSYAGTPDSDDPFLLQ